MEDRAEERPELAEHLAIGVPEVGLGHQEAGEVARPDRQGSVAAVDLQGGDNVSKRVRREILEAFQVIFGVDGRLQGVGGHEGFPGGRRCRRSR